MSPSMEGAEPSGLARAARSLLGAEARPLDGGYSGETFLVGTPGDEAVLRLYLREPERAAIDAALHRLVRGLLPVPRILEAKLSGDVEAPPFLLFERLRGVRLDLVLADPATGPDVRRAAGTDLGVLLARLSGMPFLQAGLFRGPDLAVMPFELGDLEQWVQAHRERGHFAEWSGELLEGLRQVAVDAQTLLDAGERVCLCHSDFNPKNVLVDPGSGSVIGLLDWEYAHAGAPHTDLGNLMRFETDEEFCRAVVRSYARNAPCIRSDFLDRARASDLIALIDLAGRDQPNAVTRKADALLRDMARTGELAAGRKDYL